jgi:hypothetical protein
MLQADHSGWQRLAVAVALWSFAYAAYRAYYALGGEFGMIGEPISRELFRSVNAIGAAIILVAGIVPIAAVGCCMHALVDMTLRVFSLTGVHPTQLPTTFWRSFDRHASDVQDLLLNEPWFLIEGLLWGALGVAIVQASRRRLWKLSAVTASLLLTIVGVLSGLDIIGSFHIA